MATRPMPDFIRQKIEERKAEKAAREAEEAGEEPEAEEDEDEGEGPEGEESEDDEAGEVERGPAPLRKNGLAALRKNGSPFASASTSSSAPRRRRRSFDPGRSFDDAAKWVMKNKVPVLIGLGVVGLFWLASKGKKTAPRYAYGVRGTFTDLAAKIGQQSDPPWMPSGSDLDVRTVQFYLNKIAGAGLRQDGILGKQTAAALRKFQRGNGLPETGVIDDETGNALEYFFFATSPVPRLKASAALSPESIYAFEPVTYAPYPMPGEPVTYSPYAMPSSPPQQKVTYSPYPTSPARRTASKAVAPSHVTGIQSTSMYDPRFYDYPDYVEAYWDPIPE